MLDIIIIMIVVSHILPKILCGGCLFSMHIVSCVQNTLCVVHILKRSLQGNDGPFSNCESS